MTQIPASGQHASHILAQATTGQINPLAYTDAYQAF